MSHQVNIHDAQTLILRELLFKPKAGFAELQEQTGLASDHFNFHIKKLLDLGYVDKLARGSYGLTAKGKEHANRLDTDDNTIERQPKVAVLLGIERRVDGRQELVMQQRLKYPYYGFWGFPTGKMRWGETLLEAAARELKEETSLEADLEYIGIYHEHVRLEETGEMIEDKIFHFVACRNISGDLSVEFEGGVNKWMTIDQIHREKRKFKSFEHELNMLLGPGEKLVEEAVTYSEDDF